MKLRSIVLFMIISIIFSFIFSASILAENPENESDNLLRFQDQGEEVAELQKFLRDENYYFGEIDGIYGHETLYAVFAFQKIHDLQVDGIVGSETRRAMRKPKEVSPKHGKGDIEINLSEQLLFFIKKGEVILISHISHGPTTPTGVFTIGTVERTIRSTTSNVPWTATLVFPVQIIGNYLMHSVKEEEMPGMGVPLHPASRGCVRPPFSISKFIAHSVQQGREKVHLFR